MDYHQTHERALLYTKVALVMEFAPVGSAPYTHSPNICIGDDENESVTHLENIYAYRDCIYKPSRSLANNVDAIVERVFF